MALPGVGYKRLWLASGSLLLTRSERSQLSHCEMAYEEAHMTRNLGRPPANNQEGTEALIPTICK